MHLARAFSVATTSMALMACGSGNSPETARDVGFSLPTSTLRANAEVASNNRVELGIADLSCLGTASGDRSTTVRVTLTTVVRDFLSDALVANAMVSAFDGVDATASFDTQTSDSTGRVALSIPTGRTRFGLKMTAAGSVPTLLLNQYADPNVATQTEPSKIPSVSNATVTALPSLIGQAWRPGTAVVAGVLRDCQKHEVSNFIATVSSTRATATAIAGTETYYFSSAAGLPVRHDQQHASSADGRFMAIQVQPVPSAYVQMWGFPSDADLASGRLKLIAELQIPVVADQVTSGSFEPVRY